MKKPISPNKIKKTQLIDVEAEKEISRLNDEIEERKIEFTNNNKVSFEVKCPFNTAIDVVNIFKSYGWKVYMTSFKNKDYYVMSTY